MARTRTHARFLSHLHRDLFVSANDDNKSNDGRFEFVVRKFKIFPSPPSSKGMGLGSHRVDRVTRPLPITSGAHDLMARAFSAPTPFRCAAAASTSASASTSRYSSRAVALGRRCRVAAWASGDPVPRTERLYGVDNDEDEMVQRFWRLWTGNAHCRHVVTHSPRGSVFRDPAEIEARVRRLHRFLPVVDVPMAFMREPELLRVSAEDLVRRAVRVKIALPFIDARAFHLAPAMLLASPDALADAAHALAQRGATTDKLRLQPDAILAELGYWDGGGRIGSPLEGRAARETRGLEWTGGGTTRGCTHFSRASASSRISR